MVNSASNAQLIVACGLAVYPVSDLKNEGSTSEIWKKNIITMMEPQKAWIFIEKKAL